MQLLYTSNIHEHEIGFYLLCEGLNLGKSFPVSHPIYSSSQSTISRDLLENTPTKFFQEINYADLQRGRIIPSNQNSKYSLWRGGGVGHRRWQARGQVRVLGAGGEYILLSKKEQEKAEVKATGRREGKEGKFGRKKGEKDGGFGFLMMKAEEALGLTDEANVVAQLLVLCFFTTTPFSFRLFL